MNLIKFEVDNVVLYVVPDHVVAILGEGPRTRIELVNGSKFIVNDDAETVGLKLQGRVR